ncbi:Pimeloyl-ACP methyl ester carboxylesterase [Mesonia phycicola]|uniref:Pimeloyl-ACP methyl ester carboxylesterase n=1 Tax=Mesonia phycicola TaxID=579105 RepID=A0A1M6EPG7_9FLAO|nr:alpha/beta fold hydrolase [Mesonia phycicola]SHI87306.1 Pimeloyl-ACP methyl ester carboxylesterase [Mesonia phycicola]
MQEYITYKNIQIAFTTEGKGESIVLLHGFLESSAIWRAITPILIKNHQVISIDLLGHGASQRLGYIHTMEEMAQTVHQVLLHLKVNKASFVGHSMGGYVALAFAELFPKKTEKLILLNSTSEADSVERKENRDRAKRLIKQNKDAFVSMAIKNLFAEETKEKFPEEIKQLLIEAKKIPVENIIATVEGLKNRKDRTEVLQNFKGKKMILAGKSDPVVPFMAIEKLAEQTNTELVSFSNGHMSYLENTEELINTLNNIF